MLIKRIDHITTSLVITWLGNTYLQQVKADQWVLSSFGISNPKWKGNHETKVWSRNKSWIKAFTWIYGRDRLNDFPRNKWNIIHATIVETLSTNHLIMNFTRAKTTENGLLQNINQKVMDNLIE
jgi:hypothetical protein